MPAANIKEICLRLLADREHSQQELLQKLARKGHSAECVQPVLDELASQDWQSDQRYADCYARQRIQKGYGPLSVAYALRLHGITAVDLDAIILDVAESWLALLEQTYLKKYPYNSDVISRAEWAKRSRFLLQRGFSAQLITTLFKHLQLKFE